MNDVYNAAKYISMSPNNYRHYVIEPFSIAAELDLSCAKMRPTKKLLAGTRLYPVLNSRGFDRGRKEKRFLSLFSTLVGEASHSRLWPLKHVFARYGEAKDGDITIISIQDVIVVVKPKDGGDGGRFL